MDTRIIKLAKNLIDYSCKLKKNEKIMIECFGSSPNILIKEIIKEVYKTGGIPFVSLKDYSILRELLKNCTAEQLKLMAKIDLVRMKDMDAYIGIRANDNVSELGDIASDKMNTYTRFYMDIVTEERINHTKWVVLRYPNYSMAQLANQSLEAFEDFYFKVCNLDYARMSIAMDKLVRLMEKTDIVKIKGPGTDLTFSIKNIPAIKCAGQYNIPDGEVFTAPVKTSLNGKITFNCPAVYHGVTYENIYFEFKNGKIINAISNDSKRLNKVLDTDKGSRYTGEFAIGVNPYIVRPMKDGLFDEKINGSFHLTPGRCYGEASNSNRSAIHWDLICIQTLEYGGGEIYFDGILIRKDGRFIISSLADLNPEKLK
jgi:aminopeptidase